MKRIICLIMILCLAVSVALAEGKKIEGGEARNIQINPAGDNPVEEGISPTTGRNLAEVKAEAPEGATGLAVTGRYMPIIAQISNSNLGIDLYAPVNGAWADVVYQSCLATNGADRMSFVFSDVIPDYVGFVRSTRVTHLRLRQEWDCAIVTSGWSDADVPDELAREGIKNPLESTSYTVENPGFIYPAGAPRRPWGSYYRRMIGQNGKGVPAAPNNEVFELAALVNEVVPKDYVPRNHAFRFTDEKPEGEDATFIYVKMTSSNETYSELEYDPETNTYFRYLYQNGTPVTYQENVPLDLTKTKVDDEPRYLVSGLEPGREIDFSNVIVQSVDYGWVNFERPVPELVGTGSADYFMGGKHIAGVWQRTDDNSRTVFYGEDGNEIELQRGRTLIILLDYTKNGTISYE